MSVKNSISRVFYLDVLRLLATFAVVLWHTSCLFIPEDMSGGYIGIAYNVLCRWSVPVFVMISGTLFLQPTKQIDIKTLYSHYVLRILLVFVTWYVAYHVLLDPLTDMLTCMYHGLPIEYTIGSFRHYKFHLWFLPTIMGIYILLPVFKAIVQSKVGVYYLCIWAFFSIYETLKVYHIMPMDTFPHLIEDLQIRGIYTLSGYFLLGYYLSEIKISKKMYIIAIICFGLVWAINTVGTYYKRYYTFCESLGPSIELMSISIFIIIRYVFTDRNAHPFLNRMTNGMHNELFGIYLIHAFFLPFCPSEWLADGWLVVFLIPLDTLIIFVCSFGVIRCMRKVPFFRKLC